MMHWFNSSTSCSTVVSIKDVRTTDPERCCDRNVRQTWKMSILSRPGFPVSDISSCTHVGLHGTKFMSTTSTFLFFEASTVQVQLGRRMLGALLICFLLIRGNHRAFRGSLSLHSARHELVVPTDVKKCRLDVFVSDLLPDHTRSFVANLCDNGKVTVNDKSQSKSYKVSDGDIISFDIEDKEAPTIAPEKIDLDIIYEDNSIIAINKPVGMVVHPAVGSPNGTFVNALLYHLGESAASKLFDGPAKEVVREDNTYDSTAVDSEYSDDTVCTGSVDLPETPEAASESPIFLRPGIVHRLDKGTSGVLLAGKTPQAVSKLSQLFAARDVRKVYLAVCVGHPGDTTIVYPIGRCKKNRQLMTTYEGPPGRPAITHVRTLCFDGKLSVCLVRIETGRTHQIRVHLKERRTPIVGDEAYGNADWNRNIIKSDQVRRPLLHAYETIFQHPFMEDKKIVLRAPVPDDMRRVIARMSAHRTALFTKDQVDIIDEETGLLKVTTEVGGSSIDDEINFTDGSVIRHINSEIGSLARPNKGFVPMDRLVMEDDAEAQWLSQDLPDTDDFLYQK